MRRSDRHDSRRQTPFSLEPGSLPWYNGGLRFDNWGMSVNKPNFFIAGAAKCGTTSMFEYLRQHPDVFLPKVKEPYFFGSDLALAPYWGIHIQRDDFHERSICHTYPVVCRLALRIDLCLLASSRPSGSTVHHPRDPDSTAGQSLLAATRFY